MILSEISLPGVPSAADLHDQHELEKKHRSEFQREGSPTAIRWLKGHRIKPGMKRQDVNAIVGTDGERVYEDSRYKSRGGFYRATDETYKWGPDNEGGSHLFVFRDDRLVNYDPKNFR
jgi:hypothetical protein